MLERLTHDDRTYLTALITSQNYAWYAILDMLQDKGILMKADVATRLQEVLTYIKANTKTGGLEDNIRPDFIVLQTLIDALSFVEAGIQGPAN